MDSRFLVVHILVCCSRRIISTLSADFRHSYCIEWQEVKAQEGCLVVIQVNKQVWLKWTVEMKIPAWKFAHSTFNPIVVSQGDGNIRYFEVTTEKPYLQYLMEFRSPTPQKGLGKSSPSSTLCCPPTTTVSRLPPTPTPPLQVWCQSTGWMSEPVKSSVSTSSSPWRAWLSPFQWSCREGWVRE